MRKVLSLTKLYLLGSIRSQVHLATLFLGVILLMLPAYVNAFSLGINAFERVSKDFGLTVIGYFGIAMAILLASSSIPRDIERRIIYPILARPLSRLQYIVAHFLAVAVLLALSLFVLGVCITTSVSMMTQEIDLSVFIAIFMSYLQALIVAAACIAASTWASPALAGTFGAFVFLVGSLPGAFIRFFLVEDRDSQLSATLATGLKSLLPNLSVFSLKDPVVHGLPLNPYYIPSVTVYGILWIVCLLLFGGILFGRRDL